MRFEFGRNVAFDYRSTVGPRSYTYVFQRVPWPCLCCSPAQRCLDLLEAWALVHVRVPARREQLAELRRPLLAQVGSDASPDLIERVYGGKFT